MRIAAISDIHSNVFALEAVLSDIKIRGVDVTVNLGDILYGPIAPRETYELLMEQDFVTIQGNQDRDIYEASSQDIISNSTMEFIVNDLGDDPIEWMRGLPFNCQLNDEVFLCHGTPDSDLIYLLENVEQGGPQLRSNKEISQLLGGQKSEIIFCGHTHIPRSVMLNAQQLIINPGSVGLPAYTDAKPVIHSMENFSFHANYALVDYCFDDKENAIQYSVQHNSVQHIKVPYDYPSAVKKAKQRNRDDWAHFLATGRKL